MSTFIEPAIFFHSKKPPLFFALKIQLFSLKQAVFFKFKPEKLRVINLAKPILKLFENANLH